MANKKSQGRFLKENVAARNKQQYGVPKQAPKKSAKIKPVVILFTVLALCVSIAACGFFLSKLGLSFKLPSKNIAAGVKVAGVDVGGMTKKDAAEAVAAASASYGSDSLVVTVLDKQLEIDPSVSGANLDVSAAVKEAFRYGTEENPTKNVDIIPYLNLNEEAIKHQIKAFAANFPTESETGGYDIVKETEGEEELALLTITVGSSHYDFNEDALYDIVLKAYNNHKFDATYVCNEVTAASIDLDAIYEETCKEAVNATWDPETHEVIESEIGYQFDLEAAKEALAAAQPGDVLKFPFEEVLPEIDTESIEDALFRDELGTYTAKSGSSYNRDTNLRLACEALNGTILYPGDVFSYNEALGERTPEKGYKPADSYLGDKTVQTYGGGICQPSSSLYYCALLADLEIVQRSNHGFISSYMPYGMDATVDWDGPDFKFRNNTNYPIRIDAKAEGGTVTVTLVGTDEKDYYVKMEYEIWGTSSWKTVEEEVSADSGHRDGEVKTTPYTGYTVQTYKLKYSKDTDELISREKEAYSVYAKRDKVVYKIKEEAEETTPTEPAPTDPAPTEPAPTDPAPTDPVPTDPVPTDPAPTAPPVGEAGGDVSLPGEE